MFVRKKIKNTVVLNHPVVLLHTLPMSSANDIWGKKKRGKFEKEIAPGFKSCWPKADDSHGLEVQTLDLGKANTELANVHYAISLP